MSPSLLCPNGHPLETLGTVCPQCGTRTRGEPLPPAQDPAPPAVPGYQLLGVLGRGGMGVVYKARQLSLGRLVALKMMRDGALAGPAELARFRAEAAAVARLQHPHVVQVYEVGEHAGRPFFSLELVGGGSLAERLRGTPQPPRRAAELVQTLARAVHHAHQRGIVHRDLKPGNVLLTDDGTPKVSDFGLAKHMDGTADRTATGAVLGTPGYMAPEQAWGKSKIRIIGPAADVYALGAILYELLTGRPPFQGETPVDTLQQVIGQDPVPPSRLQPTVPRDLETVCLKCLRKEPGRRYTSAADLADDLGRWLAGGPVLARPVGAAERVAKWARRRPAVAGLLAVLALVTALGFALVAWKWQEAEDALAKAEQARRAERGQKEQALAAGRKAEEARRAETVQRGQADAALARTRYELYVSLIAGAERAWRAGNWTEAAADLDRCPADLRGWEWHFLRRRCRSNHRILHVPQDTSLLALAPNGARLAVGGANDGTVWVWDRLAGLGRVSPQPVTWQGRGWRYSDPAADRRRLTIRAHAGWVSCLAFSPDARTLASGGGGELKLWDAATGKLLRNLPGPRGWVHRLAYSPDGRRLLACSWLFSGTPATTTALLLGYQAEVWDVSSGRKLSGWRNTPGPPEGLPRAAASTVGLMVPAPGPGPTRAAPLLEYEALYGRRLYPSGYYLAMAIRPDGGRIAVGELGREGTFKLAVRDALSGKELLALPVGKEGLHAAFSPDGKRLAVATLGGQLRVYDADTGRLVLTCAGQRSVKCLAFGADGRRLASGTVAGPMEIWDAQTGRLVRTLHAHVGPVAGLAFHPDGTQFLSLGGRDRTVRIWDLAAGDAGLAFGREWAGFNDGALSPDGRRLATTTNRNDLEDSTVRVWDVAAGKELFTLRGHSAWVVSLRYSRDGRHLATCSWDKTVKIWDAASGRELSTLRGHTRTVHGVAFSPDDKIIASGGEDRTIKLWDAASGREIRTLRGHTDDVEHVLFSPDGRRLVSGGRDRLIKVWDVRTGREVLTLRGHCAWGFPLLFTHEGRRLISLSYSWWGETGPAEIKVWDLAAGRALRTLDLGMSQQVCAACTPDGRRIATTTNTGRGIQLWDPETGRVVFSLPENNLIAQIIFSLDGMRLVVLGDASAFDAVPQPEIKVLDAGPVAEKARP